MAQNVDAGTISVKLKADITKYQEAIRSTMASVEKWGLKNERTYKNADGTVREHTKRYKDNLKKQSDANKDLASSTERSQQSLRNYFAATQNFLQKINISETIKGLARAFSSHELVVHRLTTQLSLSGRNVESVSADYNNFANSLEAVTTQSRSTILNMLRQAEVFGLTGTTAKRAVENALALADQNDMSAESALQLTLALQRGNSEGLEPYIEELRYMTSEGARFNHASQEMQRMFVGMTQRASGMTGEIQKLQVVYEELKIELGEPIAKAFTPLLRTFRRMVETFRNMSPAMKENIVAALSFAGALVSIGPAMTFITPLFGIMSGPLIPALRIASRLILSMVTGFSLINVVMLVAIPVIVSLISRVEGFSQVWNYVKDSAISFWNATRPIFMQLGNVGLAVFEGLLSVVRTLGDTILWALSSVLGGVHIDWMRIRDIVLEIYIALEFGIRNWRQIAVWAFSYVAYQYEKMKNEVVFIFTRYIPYALGWFSRNWKGVFSWIITNMYQWMRDLAGSWTNLILGMGIQLTTFLANPTAGVTLNLVAMIGDVPTEWGTYVQEAFDAPLRVIPLVEDMLRQEYDRIASTTRQSYLEFRAMRLEQLGLRRRDEETESEYRQQQIRREHRWTVSQYESLNATLLSSTEALDRILRYRENSLGARLPQQNFRSEETAPVQPTDSQVSAFAEFLNQAGNSIGSIASTIFGTPQPSSGGNIFPTNNPILLQAQQTPLIGDLLAAINGGIQQNNNFLAGILQATQEGALLEGANLD